MQRHVDFVYSAALRMVRDPHLAEDVTQAVFTALARSAPQLADRPVLSGWLHLTTQHLAANAVRSDVRRRAREMEAVAMHDLHEPDVHWEQMAPHLDDALGELSEPDRDALLLRYFEDKSAREMAQILGTSEEAAQKRVSRAVERLRDVLNRRGVTVGTRGLAIVIAANAVHAAPIGLCATISTAASLAGTVVETSSAVTATIAMTTLQKTIIGTTLAVAVGTGIYEARQASHLRGEVQVLRRQQAPLTGQISELTGERDDALRRIRVLQDENERLSRNATELARLRGEVARLRADVQELAQLRAAEASPADDATQLEMKSWLTRVSQLRQRLELMPDQTIPELRFVTERDWLNDARRGLDTPADYRRALSSLRSAGEGAFVSTLLQPALKQYVEAHHGELPTDLLQLRPYFESPVEDAILQRWEVAPAETIKALGLGGDIVITQRAPLDEVYDQRFGLGLYGVGSTDWLSSSIRDTMAEVNRAFAAANHGEFTADLYQLLPYATTPEQQAALHKLIERKSGE